ncbi:MAG: metal-dependent hydrolase [Chitinophagaceae bacterium]
MQKTQIQFLGHASFKVTTPEGKIILIDPWLSDNPFVPLELRSQPKVDLILITHGHEDHWDRNLPDMVRETGARLVVNNILRYDLMEQGIPEKNFEGLNMGGTLLLPDNIKVTMVQAHHPSHILGKDHSIQLPHYSVGFILQLSGDTRIYFAGDTAIFGDMKLIAEIYCPQIAVLPIGDRFTMGPLEASYSVRLLQVGHVIPFHYGTFPSLTGTPQELRRLTPDLPYLKIHALQPGEAFSFSGKES